MMNENIITLLHNSRNDIKKLLKIIDDNTLIPLMEIEEQKKVAEKNIEDIEKILDTYYHTNMCEEDKKN